eukprot:4006184-Alexandrium_andersonii.AAC.1
MTPGSALGTATAHPPSASRFHGRLPPDESGPSAQLQHAPSGMRQLHRPSLLTTGGGAAPRFACGVALATPLSADSGCP